MIPQHTTSQAIRSRLSNPAFRRCNVSQIPVEKRLRRSHSRSVQVPPLSLNLSTPGPKVYCTLHIIHFLIHHRVYKTLFGTI